MNRFGYPTKRSSKKGVWATLLSILALVFVAVGVCVLSVDTSNKITLNVLSNGETNTETIKFRGDTLTEEALPDVLESDKIFSGWYYDDNYTQKAKVGDVVEGNLKLYSRQMSLVEGAYWERVENQLALPEIGVTGSSTKESPFSTQQGTGTGSNPYIISTSEDMGVLSRLINNPEADSYYLSANYKLASDIRLDTVDVMWPSIGSQARPFTGYFDGDNKMIYYIFGTKGVFNYVQNATIQNLVVKGIKVSATSDNVGGLVSNALGETFISNCHLWGEISSSNGGVGGVVGEFSNSSTNYGTIQTSTIQTRVSGLTNVGGVVGKANNVVVQGCVNNGVIEATDVNNSNVSGIAGYANLLGLDHVINKGKITGKKYVGGIVGYQENNSLLAHNIINTGAVTGISYVGGIGGYSTDSVVTNSVNLGTVESGTNGDYVAGLIAYSTKKNATPSISYSYSLGNIVCNNSNTTHYAPIGFGDFTNGTKCGFNNIIRVGGKTVDSLNSNVTIDKGTNIYDGNPESEYTDILNSLSSKIGYSNYSDTSSGVSWNITYPWKTNIFDFTGKFPTISDGSNLSEVTYQANYYVNGTLKYIIFYTADEPVVAPQTKNTIEWFTDAKFTTKYVFGSTISSTISIYGKQEIAKPRYTVSLITNQSGVTLNPNNAKVEEGNAYTGIITNNSGVEITGVSVVMSGTQNPTFTFDSTTLTVTISNVTGNTHITPIFSSTEITYYTVTLEDTIPGLSISNTNKTYKANEQFAGGITNTSSRIVESYVVKTEGKTLSYGADYEFGLVKGHDTLTIFKITGNTVITPIPIKSNGETPESVVEIKSLHPWQIKEIANYGELGTDSNGEKVWKVGSQEWFHIGDEISFKLTNGQQMKFALADFNHDVASDGTTIHPFTFVGMNLLSDEHVMNTTNTNVGGWATSEMRTYLNSTIWNLIPEIWQQIINPAKKVSTIGNNTSDVSSSSVSSSDDNLFLLSVSEVGVQASQTPLKNYYNQEGSRYPIFSESEEDNSSRKRYTLNADGENDSVGWWWLRSPLYNNKYNFNFVNSAGVTTNKKSNTAGKFCFAFSVGVDQDNPFFDVKPLSELTPQEILDISCVGELGTDSNGEKVWKVGTKEWFHIGDETTITLTDGQILKIAIADFNHDVGLDGTSILPFTFVSMNLLSKLYQMNKSESNLNGWRDSELRTLLNSTVWDLLPEEWQDVINPAIKKTSMGNAGSTILKSEDKLFLLSVSEVGLTSSDSTSARIFNNEGTQYPIFSDNSSRVRYNLKSTGENDSAGWWWLRSPLPTDTAQFQYVKSNGTLDSDKAYYPNYLCFAFCVGMESANYTVSLETTNTKISLNPSNPHIPEGGNYSGTIINQSGYVIEDISVSMFGNTKPEYTFDPITLKVEIKNIFEDVTITPIIKCVVSLDKSVSGISISPDEESIQMGLVYEGKVTNTSGKEIAGFEICVDNNKYLYNGLQYSYDSTTNILTINEITGNTVIRPLIASEIGIPTEVAEISALTPEQIKKIASVGTVGTDSNGEKVWKVDNKEWFHIGDMVIMRLTDGQLLYVEIADFNHDVGADGTTILPFTFVAMHMLKDQYTMNTTATNSGGWANSGMKSYLNSTIWDLFPTEWQNVIDPAQKISTIGNKSSNISKSNDNLWLLSYAEVNYQSTTESKYFDTYYAKEGTAYPIFSDQSSRHRIYLYDPNFPYALIWWLRSPAPDSDGAFDIACSGLGGGSSFVATSSYGVVPAFCIGADPTISPIRKKNLSDYTPEEILYIGENGQLGTDSNGNKVWKFDGEEWFHIGDQTTITLTDGQILKIAIADFNHDVGADGSTIMPFTFTATHILATKQPMNSTVTNTGGWKDSELRTYMNETLWNLFPEEWKAVIGTTKKTTTKGSQSSDTQTTDDKLFLFSIYEVGLSVTTAYDNSHYIKEGTRYPIFSGVAGADCYKKYLLDSIGNTTGSATMWWLRSPCAFDNGYFHVVSGTAQRSQLDSDYLLGVSPVFCVGPNTTAQSNVKALANCSPAEIKQIASGGSLGTDSNGNKVWIYDGDEWFHIGDQTSITLSDGQIFKVAIADFNHDVNSSGATLPFSFVGMNVLKDTHGMNTSSSNSGGWSSSNMKTYLNSTIWNLFPADWRAIITPTKKTSTTGSSSSSTSSVATNLFLLSFTEVGHTSSSYDSSHYTKEGTLYPIFTDSNSRLRYTLDAEGNNATPQWWWLRSPVANNSMGFTYVSNTGIYMSGYNRSADGNFYVCPGFCV